MAVCLITQLLVKQHLTHAPSTCQEQEIAETAGPFAADSTPARVIAFASATEALDRTLLLAGLTWDPRARSCALLTPAAATHRQPQQQQAAAAPQAASALMSPPPKKLGTHAAGKKGKPAAAAAVIQDGRAEIQAPVMFGWRGAADDDTPRSLKGWAVDEVAAEAPFSPAPQLGAAAGSTTGVERGKKTAAAAGESRLQQQRKGKGRHPWPGLKLPLPLPLAVDDGSTELPPCYGSRDGSGAGSVAGSPVAGSDSAPVTGRSAVQQTNFQQAEAVRSARRQDAHTAASAAAQQLGVARSKVAAVKAGAASGGGGRSRSVNTSSSAVVASCRPCTTAESSQSARSARVREVAEAAASALQQREQRSQAVGSARQQAAERSRSAGAALRVQTGALARAGAAQRAEATAHGQRLVRALHMARLLKQGRLVRPAAQAPSEAGAGLGSPPAGRQMAEAFGRRVGRLEEERMRRHIIVRRAAVAWAAGQVCAIRKAEEAAARQRASAAEAAAAEAAAARAAQQPARTEVLLAAAGGVWELEAVARRAATQSRRLGELESLQRFGPSGGLFGSKRLERQEVQVMLVGCEAGQGEV